jgi:hypothetical protein
MTNSPETNPPSDGLRQAAAAALADVDALALSGDDRNTVLGILLKARLGGSAPPTPAGNGDAKDKGKGENNHVIQDAVADGDLIGKISAALKLDRDLVELVYAAQDGEPTVVVSAKKIASNKAEGTRQLAQLVSAARQITGLEEWTSSATIRPVVTNFGRLNVSNFAATLQQMDNVALIRGKGQQREVKITKPGIENTADLVKSLVGTE